MTSLGKGGLAGVTKGLEVGRLPWMTDWAQCVIMRVLIRDNRLAFNVE